MNIDPQTGKNYGLPPTAEDVRNFAAELDDRDEATQEELDMLRHVAERLEVLEKERDEARRKVCMGEAIIRLQRNRVHRESEEVLLVAKEISIERGWDCFNDEDTDA